VIQGGTHSVTQSVSAAVVFIWCGYSNLDNCTNHSLNEPNKTGTYWSMLIKMA